MTPHQVRQTHTVATLAVPRELYEFVAKALRDAGYDHLFMHAREAIDMSGIAIVPQESNPDGQRLA